jgi:NADPH:quinone reductase-like Zn-dependent oxidoreductase
MTVRAVRVHAFGSPADVVVENVPAPKPGPGEVVIDVHASGLNFPDLLVVSGRYQVRPPLPFSPGKEVAGVVVEAAPDVASPRPGQRVMAQLEYGGYRERVSVPAELCVPVPDGMSCAEAGGFGLVHLTAHAALVRRARLRAGEIVLVTGAGGGVGGAVVGLAKALGATVIAVARDERRRAASLGQGADHALVADPATLRDQVRELTGGHGADVVVESVGGDLFAACLRCVAWEGRLVVVGFAGGDIPSVKAGYLLVKNIGLLGLQASDYRDREPAYLRAVLAELLALHGEGALRASVEAVFPLEKAAEALAGLERGGLTGRLILGPRACGCDEELER